MSNDICNRTLASFSTRDPKSFPLIPSYILIPSLISSFSVFPFHIQLQAVPSLCAIHTSRILIMSREISSDFGKPHERHFENFLGEFRPPCKRYQRNNSNERKTEERRDCVTTAASARRDNSSIRRNSKDIGQYSSIDLKRKGLEHWMQHAP